MAVYTTIDDPSAYFQTKLYTGGTAEAKTFDGNSNLKPDWFWSKKRGAVQFHATADSSRGIANALRINTTGAEYTNTEADDLASFDTNGFTFDGTGDTYNGTYQSSSYVAWCWAANGGTTSSNSSGDITTTVQANTTAGFSIATYTGNGGSGQTLGHGLGAEPDIVIFKDRDSASAWRMYTKMTGASKFLNLNTTDAAGTSPNVFPSVSSTTIGVEQNDVMNKNNSDFVMYSFRSIQGYSRFGSYTGNGNTDGPFIYTGFKPAWVMIKLTSSTENWIIMDNKRDTFNNAYKTLLANADSTEDTSNDARYSLDFLSNGFKVRSNAHATSNGSGSSYIYMAFAESPFVSSEGVPATAR